MTYQIPEPYWNDPQNPVALQEPTLADEIAWSLRTEVQGYSPQQLSKYASASMPQTHKEWGRVSFIYFVKHYLSSHTYCEFAEAHYDLARELQDETKRKRLLWLFPREHAKCQSGDALVQMVDGTLKKLKNILPGDQVISVDGYKLQQSTVTWAGFTGKKPMLKVTTESGSELKISYVHKLRTFDGWVQGADLEVGEHIATPKFIPEPHNEEEFSDEQVALLGYWIAEGCRGRGNINISNHDTEVLDDIRYCAASLGLTSRLVIYKGKAVGIRLHKGVHVITDFGIDPVTCGAYEKYVPDAIFKASNRQVAVFLSTLFEGDGCTHNIRGKPVVSYATASERLARDIKALLLRFGIVSRVSISHTYGKPFWIVSLQGADSVERYRHQIGFFTKRIKPYTADRQQARHELIPAQWRELRNNTVRYTDLREVGIRIDNEYDTTADKVRKVAVLEGNQELLDIVDGDLWWDKILSIEPIDEEETYDIQVEGTHNYVSDNVVSHNTTIVTFAYVLWCILYRVKQNIVIISDTQDQSKEFLRNIKTELITNDLIIQDFGDLEGNKKNGGKWDERHIITGNKVQVKTLSPGSQVRGLVFNQRKEVWLEDQQRYVRQAVNVRPDLVILDDVVNDKWIKNKKVRDEMENWFFSPLVNAIDSDNGDIVIVGTIVHHDDLMNRLWKDNERCSEANGWIKHRTPACVFNDSGEISNVLWEGRWDADKLRRRRNEIGSLAFSKEFLLQPIEDTAKMFNKEWHKHYLHHTLPPNIAQKLMEHYNGPPSDLLIVTAIDPNISKDDEADYTVVMTVGFSPTTRGYYVIDVFRERPTPKRQVDEMVDQAARWGKQYRTDDNGWVHLGFVVESHAYQASIAYWLRRALKKRKMSADIVCRSENIDKTLRCSMMSPVAEQGRFYFPVGWRSDQVTNVGNIVNTYQVVEDELDEFPQGSYKDCVDALQRCYSRLVKEERKYVKAGRYGLEAISSFEKQMDAYASQKEYFDDAA